MQTVKQTDADSYRGAAMGGNARSKPLQLIGYLKPITEVFSRALLQQPETIKELRPLQQSKLIPPKKINRD